MKTCHAGMAELSKQLTDMVLNRAHRLIQITDFMAMITTTPIDPDLVIYKT